MAYFVAPGGSMVLPCRFEGSATFSLTRLPFILPLRCRIFIVMDFIEHDLKELMSGMRAPFLQSEVKTLMLQLLSATELLHENWILHRDLKTSNLLLNNKGEIKVADFGLARRYGEPQGMLTQPVVTLWYRYVLCLHVDHASICRFMIVCCSMRCVPTVTFFWRI